MTFIAEQSAQITSPFAGKALNAVMSSGIIPSSTAAREASYAPEKSLRRSSKLQTDRRAWHAATTTNGSVL